MFKIFCDGYLLYDPRLESLKLFDPRLDLELNKTGSLSFKIYPDHPYSDKLKKLKSIIQVYQDDDLIFRGRILNEEQGFYNERQVSCEGELAFLCDSVQRPYDFMSGSNHTTIPELFTFFINRHNAQVTEERRFKVGTITVSDPNNYIVRSDSTYLNTWDSINQKLIETNGGYLWVRHEPDGNYIDYLEDFEAESNQTIEFGKNLLSLDRQIKGENIATAIIPLGAKQDGSEQRLTISGLPNSQTGEIYKYGDYVYSPEAVSKYGWIFKTQVWDDVTQASNLLSNAKKYIGNTIYQLTSIELTGFDLAGINKDFDGFKLGTYIKVYTEPHDLNEYFLIKKLSIELSNPQNNVLTLGQTYATFTEQQTRNVDVPISVLTEKVSRIETIIDSGDQPQEERKAITLLNGWQNYGNGYESAVYWKDTAKIVHVCGLVKSGKVAEETVLFELPEGYRPRASEKFLVSSVNNSCVLEVDLTGQIKIRNGANSGWINLSGISFRV